MNFFLLHSIEQRIAKERRLYYMWRRIRLILWNRKGFGGIEIAISSLIVLLIVCGLIDVLKITQRFEVASQANNYISRTVQEQGGVRANKIENFSGKYTTSQTLYNNVKDMMEASGIAETDWTLTIQTEGGGSYIVNQRTNVPLVNYGKRIKVILSVNYRWDMLSAALPGDWGGTRSSIKEVLSGYQIRDNNGMTTELELK